MERYQKGLHYALEAQRQHHRGDLYRALESAQLKKPFKFSNWVRLCTYRYSHQPLNAYGSTIGAGGRFNYGDALDSIDSIPFPALYLGENRTVAYREYFGMPPSSTVGLTAQEFMLSGKKDISIIHINGTVHNVLDVTRPTRLKDFVGIISSFTVSDEIKDLARVAGIQPRPLVSTPDEMMKMLYELRWRGWVRQHGLPASCQLFGKLVWEAQYDAILYRSTRGGGKCLAVFPQNLQKSETHIQLAGTPPPNVNEYIDASNWQLSTSP